MKYIRYKEDLGVMNQMIKKRIELWLHRIKIRMDWLNNIKKVVIDRLLNKNLLQSEEPKVYEVKSYEKSYY